MGKTTTRRIRVSFAIPSAMVAKRLVTLLKNVREGAKPVKSDGHVEAKVEVREKEEETAKGLFRRRTDSQAISEWK